MNTGTRGLPAAVLWDLDGTLVDTEPYWIAAEFEVVREHGNGRWSEEHGHALVGSDLRVSGDYIKRQGEVHLEVDEIVECLLDEVIRRVRERVPWRPGARELLAALNEHGVPCALVTMSWRRFAMAVVDVLPARSFHEVVVGDEVANGKPHPEPYLLGAQRLGVDPAHCVAIEDSPTGIRSAIAAGCQVIAVPNVVAIDAQPNLRIVTSLTELSPTELAAPVARG
jgi:HAD superfamily hydrolase (TIGR01509 family)